MSRKTQITKGPRFLSASVPFFLFLFFCHIGRNGWFLPQLLWPTRCDGEKRQISGSKDAWHISRRFGSFLRTCRLCGKAAVTERNASSTRRFTDEPFQFKNPASYAKEVHLPQTLGWWESVEKNSLLKTKRSNNLRCGTRALEKWW